MENRKPKIAFVHIFRIDDIRYFEFLSYIILRLSQILNNQYEVIFIYNGNIQQNTISHQDVKVIQFDGSKSRSPIGPISFIKIARSIRRICIREKIDVVGNLTDHYLLFPIIIGAKLAKAKCIARVVGRLPTPKNASLVKKTRKAFARLAERFSLRVADKVLCLSSNLKKQLVERGTEGAKISVISQGVDVHFFGQRSLEALSAKPRRILYVGRLVKNKGVKKGIETYLKIRQMHPDLEFIICGHGKEGPQLMKQYGDIKHIKFKGFVPRDRLRDIYLNADILFLPSRSEGLPNVVIEAMASKLPVVATGVGEVPNLLANGRGFCTVDCGVKSLANGLDRMIRDDKFRIRCAIEAYQYILEYHSFEAVKKSTLDFFSNLKKLTGNEA